MKYYTDGFVDGHNPSSKGGGYTVMNEKGDLIKRRYVEKNPFTNNQAEILGILSALEICDDGDTVSTDSMVCLTWVNTGRSKARPDLNPMLAQCKMLKELKCINLMWEGREFNLAGIFNEKNGGWKIGKLGI